MAYRILYVGERSGTCLHRAEALRRLGHEVDHLDHRMPRAFWPRQLHRAARRLRWHPDMHGTNRALVQRLDGRPYDLLWIDKGLSIRPATLRRARRLHPALPIVSYSPDNMFHPTLFSIQYRRSIPLVDLHVTTKSFSIDRLRRLGARDVLFLDNAYDPETHRPVELSPDERRHFAADVGFVGMYERERAELMWRLAEDGVPVTVHGSGWERTGRDHPNLRVRNEYLDGLDYARAVSATKINLGFLRREAADLQTTRSIEIPACGGFLLGERSAEHLRLFEEGREAEFFETYGELLDKCRRYLADDEGRRRIAAAGHRRCLEGGYSNDRRLATVLDHLRRSGRL